MINLSVLSQFFLERWQRVSLHFDIWALFRRKKEPDQKKIMTLYTKHEHWTPLQTKKKAAKIFSSKTWNIPPRKYYKLRRFTPKQQSEEKKTTRKYILVWFWNLATFRNVLFTQIQKAKICLFYHFGRVARSRSIPCTTAMRVYFTQYDNYTMIIRTNGDTTTTTTSKQTGAICKAKNWW